MTWSKRFRKAATRMATIIALAGCLAAQTANWVTARSTVKVYDQPLEKHFLYYSRGQAVDNIAPGERFLVKEHRIVQTAEAARHIAHELHPSELDDLSLITVLRSYCEDFATRVGIPVQIRSRKIPPGLRREIGSCLYRVAQESLSNIAKHAAAKRVSVVLEGTGKVIRLRVKDSGVGFKTGSRENKIGLGLLGMEERVRLLRGNFVVSSRLGKGTEITAEIPLES